MDFQTPKYKLWREADRLACAAEHVASELLRKGPPPSHDVEVASAHLLRTRAHEMFEDAMEEIGRVARSLLHGQSPGPKSAAAPPDDAGQA